MKWSRRHIVNIKCFIESFFPSSSSSKPERPLEKNFIKIEARPWSDTPRELLECITSFLDVSDLLSFRGVCKDWKLASSRAMAQVGSDQPCLLAIDNSECIIFRLSKRKDIATITELCEAKCIGSNFGWLLLLKENSILFFCPFSRAKIELPNFPFPESSNLVAAFSSPPTCKDCVVSVISQNSGVGNYVDIHMLQRGDNSWITYKHYHGSSSIGTIVGAAYSDCDKSFYFFDATNGVVIYSLGDKKTRTSVMVINLESEKTNREKPSFRFKKCNVDCVKVGLENASISTCGMFIDDRREKAIEVFCNENIKMDADRKVKGVWIHPQIFELSPEQQESWSKLEGVS
ncbi:hypothetical protein ACFE04_026418 [Oxalis oulophora]